MRITSGMITSQYNRNLNRSLSQLNYYNNRATTLRKFDRASQDPVAASKAYKLRRSYSQNEDFSTNVDETKSMMLTAESAIMNLSKIAQEVSSSDILQGVNGTMSTSDREVVATKLEKLQGAMISTLNVKYGDKFLFGGANTSKPPFTLDTGGNLLYRGVNVTTGEYAGASATAKIDDTSISFGVENGAGLNGYTLNVTEAVGANLVDNTNKTININLPTGSTKQDLQDALQALTTADGLDAGIDATRMTVDGNLTDTVSFGGGAIKNGENIVTGGVEGQELLQKLAKETQFVDLGLGLKFNGADLDEQSVFDTSLPGISFMGFGEDADGNPNNIYSLLGKIASDLKSPSFDLETTQPFINKFNDQKQNVLSKLTEFGSKSNFLDYVETRLDDNKININSRIESVEYVDTAEAIMDFKMQEYSYMAALQMGTKIIQPTFLDYMR